VLQISVLGAVEVRRDGRLVSVPGGKTTELLVRLALDAGVLVPADRLVDDLWAGAVTRRNTLQSKVARLRRALGDPELIISGHGGYKLAVEPAVVDAPCVLRDADAAARRLDTGDARGAAELSAAALRRYVGELLHATGDWAAPHRARLEEARVKLIETQFSARLQLGEAVIGELEAAVAAYPYQEGLWELLITALYRAGRQADALATYQRVRTRLADELGLEPGPPLKELERQILNHDPGLRVPDRPAQAGNLPSLSLELVGRDKEIAVLSELLDGNRLVEVVGPGGIGKTVVAIATGRALSAVPGGVWLVRLEAAQTADDVLDTVIAALNVTGGQAALLERLRRVAAVVILDNCEHVIHATAPLAERLLDAAPGLRILCTSEVVFELAPLRSPTPWSCSPVAPPGTATPARCTTCAGRWTAYRWRSNSPRRAPGRCRSRRSPGASTIASACSATRPAASPSDGERSGRRSGGATSCCSPTTSGACGRWPRSPAARRLPRSSPSWKPSMCPGRARSMSSGDSRAVRW
jgi:DNA-binding SARP family transcriptional activator